jgi:dTDP-4-amino-4,6-dideoxygalactose transaminase
MSEDERDSLLSSFDSGWVAPVGPDLDAFEKEFADRIGAKYAVAVSSGTAALHLALNALGVGHNDEVVTSTLTFVATANAIRYTGAQPVFIDSEAYSWNLDPDLLAEELHSRQSSGRQVAAVIAVDIFGQCADYQRILDICARYGVPLIEDAAEALGARYLDKPAGSFGKIACFSFNGNKIITTSGGGMVVTDDQQCAERIRHLSTQAREPAVHYEHRELGYNYRLSNLLAGIGRAQLRRLDSFVARRRAIFDYYRKELGDLPGLQFMPEPEACWSTRWLTCVLIDETEFGASRDDVMAALDEQQIESRPVWKPMHLQPLYCQHPIRGGDVAKRLFETGLCLPSGSSLTDQQLRRITEIIKRVATRESYSQ